MGTRGTGCTGILCLNTVGQAASVEGLMGDVLDWDPSDWGGEEKAGKPGKAWKVIAGGWGVN